MTPIQCPFCSSTLPGEKEAYCIFCGQMLPQGGLLQQRYHLLQTIGRGGMGQVYLAQDRQVFDRRCAIKRIGPPQIQLDQKEAEREAQMLAQLQNSGIPGIPDIYDIFNHNNSFFVVMKYIEGRNLLELDSSIDDWQVIVRQFIQVLKIINCLHRLLEPVVHTDIKPHNILQDRHGQIWLVDFGISRRVTGGQEHASTASDFVPAGTPAYMPWEQWSRRPTPAADIYAAAMSLYSLLVGNKKFKQLKPGPVNAGTLPRPGLTPDDYFDSGWPAPLKEALLGATCQNPQERISAAHFLELLENSLPAVKKSAPLILQDGSKIYLPVDLIDISERDWAYAVRLVKDGTFISWIRQEHYQDDLATRIEAIKNRCLDASEALESILQILKPDLPKPHLTFEPQRIVFKPVGVMPRQTQMKFANAGRGYLGIQLSCNQPGITIEPERLALSGRASQEVTITCAPEVLVHNRTKTERVIQVQSMGQNSAIPVEVHQSGIERAWLLALHPLFQFLRSISGFLCAWLLAFAFPLPVIENLLTLQTGGFNAVYILQYLGLSIVLSMLGAVVGLWIGRARFNRPVIKLLLLRFCVYAFFALILTAVYHFIAGSRTLWAMLGGFSLFVALVETLSNSWDKSIRQPPWAVITGPLVGALLVSLFLSASALLPASPRKPPTVSRPDSLSNEFIVSNACPSGNLVDIDKAAPFYQTQNLANESGWLETDDTIILLPDSMVETEKGVTAVQICRRKNNGRIDQGWVNRQILTSLP